MLRPRQKLHNLPSSINFALQRLEDDNVYFLFISHLLRSFGQVVFLDDTISGIIIPPTPAASASEEPVIPLFTILATIFTCARLPGRCPIIESAKEITLRVSPPVFIITAASTKKGTAVNKKLSDPITDLWAKPINERSLKTKNSMVDAINENAIGTPIITSIAIIISESSAIIYHQE